MPTNYQGALFLIEIEDPETPAAYIPVACMRSTTVTLNNEMIDVTSKCNDPWRHLMAGGIRSLTLAGSGVFNDDASMAELIAANVEGRHVLMKATSDYGDEFSGSFAPTTVERSGEHTDAEQYSFTFESAGVVTYAAAP